MKDGEILASVYVQALMCSEMRNSNNLRVCSQSPFSCEWALFFFLNRLMMYIRCGQTLYLLFTKPWLDDYITWDQSWSLFLSHTCTCTNKKTHTKKLIIRTEQRILIYRYKKWGKNSNTEFVNQKLEARSGPTTSQHRNKLPQILQKYKSRANELLKKNPINQGL